jgi:hypothetical protein
LNTPLMATREFAVLKFLYNDNELADYLALTTINNAVYKRYYREQKADCHPVWI